MAQRGSWVVAGGVLLVACATGTDRTREEVAPLFGPPLQAPTAAQLTDARVALGRALFWDVRSSSNGRVACASCHEAADWSSDRRRQSLDARGKLTARHSQPIFNAMLQPSLRWTGDRAHGAAQAEGSMTGSMGYADKAAAVARLKELGYEDAFKAAFPPADGGSSLSAANYGLALQAYQRTLITPAPFDRYLQGRDDALTPLQKQGLRSFVSAGCAGCHNGPLLGGQQFQKFGLHGDYWRETGSEPIDEGRFLGTKNPEDKYVFRVAMLRNVARTAPYFHDGSVPTLEAAVRVMAKLQLGRTLPEEEVGSIVAFLGTLTGEVPANYSAPAP